MVRMLRLIGNVAFLLASAVFFGVSGMHALDTWRLQNELPSVATMTLAGAFLLVAGAIGAWLAWRRQPARGTLGATRLVTIGSGLACIALAIKFDARPHSEAFTETHQLHRALEYLARAESTQYVAAKRYTADSALLAQRLGADPGALARLVIHADSFAWTATAHSATVTRTCSWSGTPRGNGEMRCTPECRIRKTGERC